MNERLNSDVDYIRNGSFKMDIVVMARTLINRENAY
jgi:lipopolysaccharide/colanic/teichoic acid biosynthesis glycosyltransferase